MIDRLAIGCVADNSTKYLDQALRLLQSWRWFAGSLADAPFHVCVVEDVPEKYREKYEYYGAHVHIVQRFSMAHPPSNKLRFLELPQLTNADRVILLDCDTIIVQEPSDLLERTDFIAKIADSQSVTLAVFETLFDAFEIPMPCATECCTVRGEQTIPYFNAGVLSFSRKAMDTLVPEWIRINQELVGRLELLGSCSNFCEQASLSLAVAECATTFQALTNRSNFPGHCHAEPPDSEFANTDPVLIHYHWLVDEQGFLLPTPYSKVNGRIEAFNVRLFKERRVQFDNRSFWDSRYINNPKLGSGIGSRGCLKIYKQALLESVVNDIRPSSTLDVGCGDMVVSGGLLDQGYTGIDVSLVVIQANAKAYPKRRFIYGDFVSLGLEKHDLVLCLDVLIHIPHRTDYLSCVVKCVKTAGKAGVIAAYEETPAMQSDITFYHEPISQTLRNAGAVGIRQIGAYGRVRVFQFGTTDDAIDGSIRLAKPIFLVGAMRSGSTLLANMLGDSPHIAHCSFELKDIWSRVGGVPMASPKTRDHNCLECRAEDAHHKMQEELVEAFEGRMAALTGKFEGATFLNKNPHLCNKLEMIMALFPDARIIWIYRDLPQVVASLKKLFSDVYHRQSTRHWWPKSQPSVRNRCWNAIHFDEGWENAPADRAFPGGDVRHLAEYWLESNRAVAEFFAGPFRSRCIPVAEDLLIASPGEQIARIFGYLQLPYSEIQLPAIDKERNELWEDILHEVERASLLHFVEERRDEIDYIFPGKGRAELYLNQLKKSE